MSNLLKVTALDHRVRRPLKASQRYRHCTCRYIEQTSPTRFSKEASVVRDILRHTYTGPSDLFLGSNNLDKDHLDDPFSEVVSECA